MAIGTQWEHFVRVLCQLEIESMLVAGRMQKCEKLVQVIQTSMAIFAPASAAAGLMSWVDPFPEIKKWLDIIWHCLVWLTALLAVPLASIIAPKVRDIRKLTSHMQTLLSTGRVILNAAHYEDTDSIEWQEKAMNFTNRYSNEIIFYNLKFSDKEMIAAQDTIIALYENYLINEETKDG
jgi:hypothetical protein